MFVLFFFLLSFKSQHKQQEITAALVLKLKLQSADVLKCLTVWGGLIIRADVQHFPIIKIC